MSGYDRHLRRNFGSNSMRSAGVWDSTYGIRDEAHRSELTFASEELRDRIMSMYARKARQQRVTLNEAAVLCGMRA